MSLPNSSVPATPTAPEPVAYAYVVLVILSLLNVLNYVDRFIFAALLPYIKQDTGYTDQQLGWVGSALSRGQLYAVARLTRSRRDWRSELCDDCARAAGGFFHQAAP